MGVFCYLDGFPDDTGSVGPGNGSKFCSVEVDVLFFHSEYSAVVWCL
jgi:hypothetical protein